MSDPEALTAMLSSGQIHAGQSLAEFLRLCIPAKMERYGRYTFIQAFETPALYGIFILSKDGTLVHAEQWDDYNDPESFFSVITDAERETAIESYHSKSPGLFGG